MLQYDDWNKTVAWTTSAETIVNGIMMEGATVVGLKISGIMVAWKRMAKITMAGRPVAGYSCGWDKDD